MKGDHPSTPIPTRWGDLEFLEHSSLPAPFHHLALESPSDELRVPSGVVRAPTIRERKRGSERYPNFVERTGPACQEVTSGGPRSIPELITRREETSSEVESVNRKISRTGGPSDREVDSPSAMEGTCPGSPDCKGERDLRRGRLTLRGAKVGRSINARSSPVEFHRVLGLTKG